MNAQADNVGHRVLSIDQDKKGLLVIVTTFGRFEFKPSNDFQEHQYKALIDLLNRRARTHD